MAVCEVKTSHTWRIWAVAVLGVVGVISILATSRLPVPTGGPDTSPPTIHFGSAGLPTDLVMTDPSATSPTRRARSTDDVLLVATAYDYESGMAQVSIRGEMLIECVPTPGNINMVRIRDPIAEINSGATPPAVRLSQSFTIRIPDQRARCPATTTFHQLTATLHAQATNVAGQSTVFADAIVRHYGPDTVRVATFNMWNPGNHADEVFVRWGQTAASQADVIFMQEVPDQRRAELVATSAGMSHLIYYINTAVASRARIRDVKRRDVSGSIIVSGVTDLRGWPHQVVSVHFTTHGSPGNVPWLRSQLRVDAANETLSLLAPAPEIAIVGGDFNAYSGVGPQIQSGSTEEMDLMRARLRDVYTTLGLADDQHCSNQRIDYILIQGPYVPTAYNACSGLGTPSDHPFVLATLAVN
jgi:endonuclease/exonuclease/phosphatase family metal-dependent hydrolase